MSGKETKDGYDVIAGRLDERGVDVESVKEAIKSFEVEVPSWVFGEFGGGRFGGYLPPGPAPDSRAKFEDAALVHQLTGACPNVAIHLGWDKPDGVDFADIRAEHFGDLRDFAHERGLGIGAVNPTLFLEGTHHGSLSAPDASTRQLMIDHCKVACEVAREYAGGLVTYWLPDGSLYPGQRGLWHQEKLVRDGLAEIYEAASDSVVHLIEYKLFEPGTYSTVLSDYGVALDIARSLGDRAGVLVDMGHHAWGVNVAQIVARLVGLGVRGGLHFNSRYAADDDHAVEPGREVYAIFCELAGADAVINPDESAGWAYMIDQCSSLEKRIPAVLHTIDSLQVSLAKALILDRDRLEQMQDANDVIGANRVFLDAFLTDVRPLVEAAREEQGLPADPVAAFAAGGYQERIERERGA